MDKLFKYNDPTQRQQKIEGVRGIAQKPKVIRKFNESWENNRSWLLFK